MEYFSVTKDSDIFENESGEIHEEEYVPRPTVKGLVFDTHGNICVYTIHGRTLFPGGGVEGDETAEQAFIRECKEEIGCDIKIASTLGKAIEYRKRPGKKYEITFFIAKVVGEKGAPTTTQIDEVGIKIDWLPAEEIHSILEKQIHALAKDVYMPYFACRTHLAAFKKYLEMKK